jgi:hypothetical protein
VTSLAKCAGFFWPRPPYFAGGCQFSSQGANGPVRANLKKVHTPKEAGIAGVGPEQLEVWAVKDGDDVRVAFGNGLLGVSERRLQVT